MYTFNAGIPFTLKSHCLDTFSVLEDNHRVKRLMLSKGAKWWISDDIT